MLSLGCALHLLTGATAATPAGTPAGHKPGHQQDHGATAGIPPGQAGTPAETSKATGGTGQASAQGPARPENYARNFAHITYDTNMELDFPVGGCATDSLAQPPIYSVPPPKSNTDVGKPRTNASLADPRPASVDLVEVRPT